ncbi:hypothetical protein DYB32_010305 [Aphanomyces invadans]|uniref:CCHC-type domain-containing protein n=1 Tax=Aphanomyces invadans TaxID=157072 RepID=A0A418AGF5_9STRA|nr:hypothetical protein DYB32_010305 [Aphanomyces invadans]
MPPVTLTNHNFAVWRVWLIAKLQTKKLANYLTWDGVATDEGNGFQYDALDGFRALGILTESLSESQYQYVEGADCVKRAMDNLTAIHEPIGAADRVGLLEEYHTLRWDWKKMTLDEFIGVFRDLMRRLDRANLHELPAFRVTKLLSRMPKEMRMVSHMIMDSAAAEHTVPIAATKLLAEYKYLQKEGLLKLSGRGLDEAILVAGQDQRDGAPESRRKPRASDKCNNCGILGHWARDCRKQGGGAYQRRQQQDNSQARVNAAKHENPRFEDCLFAISHGEGQEDNPKAGHPMVMDSGASCHITGNSRILYDRVPCNRSVVVADGHRMSIKEMGKVKIKGIDGASLVLTDVLFEPTVQSTLISIPRMTVDNPDVNVSFNDQTCSIQVQGRLIATAKFDQRTKLFVFEGNHNSTMDDYVGLVLPKPADLWHYRMGHVQIDNMRWCSKQHSELPDFKNPLEKM